MSAHMPTVPPRRPRACIELGVCQSRPDCGACSRRAEMRAGDREAFYFAPGTVQGGASRRRAGRLERLERIARAILVVAMVAAVGAVIGALGGWLHVGAPLP